MYTNGKKVVYPDVNLDGFLSTIKQDEEISLKLLKTHKVMCSDENHQCLYESWSVYKCLYSELDLNDDKYILNDGKWYRINQDFVSKTNGDFLKIEKSSELLPNYRGGSEGSYNQYVAMNFPDKYFLLDDKNKIFHGGGHGQVEVCDLFSKDKNLIHVKKYGKSSVLSHLFSQGFVSGQLLQLDSIFREKVKGKLGGSFKGLIDVDKRPDEDEFTVTYAVISNSSEEDLHLPFFSRVNLNNIARILKGFGYKVEILKINCEESYSKTKHYPPSKKIA